MSMTWLLLSGKVDGGENTGEKAANPVTAWPFPNVNRVDFELKANQIISTALSQHKIEIFVCRKVHYKHYSGDWVVLALS